MEGWAVRSYRPVVNGLQKNMGLESEGSIVLRSYCKVVNGLAYLEWIVLERKNVKLSEGS